MLNKHPISIDSLIIKQNSMYDLVFYDDVPKELVECVYNKCSKEVLAFSAHRFFSSCGREAHAFLIERMLNDGFNPLITNKEGDCALHHTHQPETIRRLVAHGVNVNHQNASGSTPLNVMVDYANTDTISALIECGANPLIRDNYGRLPRNALEEARAAFDNPSPAYNDVEEILKKAELQRITTLQSPLKKMGRMQIKKPGAG